MNNIDYAPDLDLLCIFAASLLAASEREDLEAGATGGLVEEGAIEDMAEVGCLQVEG